MIASSDVFEPDHYCFCWEQWEHWEQTKQTNTNQSVILNKLFPKPGNTLGTLGTIDPIISKDVYGKKAY